VLYDLIDRKRRLNVNAAPERTLLYAKQHFLTKEHLTTAILMRKRDSRRPKRAAVANIVAPRSSLSALALQIVNGEQAISNVSELIARAETCIRTWVLHRSDIAAIATNGTPGCGFFSSQKSGGGSLFAADDKRTFGANNRRLRKDRV